MTVADFGCANGVLLDVIHHRVGRYMGVDFSAEFIAAARERQEKTGIVNASFHCEPIVEFCKQHPRAFDRGFALDFSEHVYDDDFREIAAAIHGSLKPNGRLYMHTPNAEFAVEILKDRGILRQHPEHVAVRNAENNIRLLKEANFRDVRVVYLSHYLKHVAWVDVFSNLPVLGKYFRARLFIEGIC